MVILKEEFVIRVVQRMTDNEGIFYTVFKELLLHDRQDIDSVIAQLEVVNVKVIAMTISVTA